jgi:hypothetical protein
VNAAREAKGMNTSSRSLFKEFLMGLITANEEIRRIVEGNKQVACTYETMSFTPVLNSPIETPIFNVIPSVFGSSDKDNQTEN